MTERLKTLNAIRNDICRKLRELEAKKEAYNDILKSVIYQIGFAEMQDHSKDAYIEEDTEDEKGN